MKRWIVRLGLAGAFAALAFYLWSRMNEDYDDEDLEDEIPIEFEVPLSDPAPLGMEQAPEMSEMDHDTGVGPGASLAEAPASAPTNSDDLTVIRGIGPVFQTRLNELGIHSYRQLAEADPERLEADGIHGADIADWVSQARQLAEQATP